MANQTRLYGSAFFFYCCATILIALTAAPAWAVDQPIVFRRIVLELVPPELPTDAPAEAKAATSGQPPQSLPVEIRPFSLFQEPATFSMQLQSPTAAYLVFLEGSTEVVHSLRPAPVYHPLDIVIISPLGKVLQILPDMALNNLESPHELPAESHAILYLSSGRAAALGIQPNSVFKSEFFATQPVILK